jgi:hypothetical protein
VPAVEFWTAVGPLGVGAGDDDELDPPPPPHPVNKRRVLQKMKFFVFMTHLKFFDKHQFREFDFLLPLI